MFTGSEEKNRKIVNNQGSPISFAGSAFSWTAEQFNNDVIIQQAINHHRYMSTPYAAVSIDNGPYIAGGLAQIKELFKTRQDYTIKTVLLKAPGTTYHRGPSARSSSPFSRELEGTWLNGAGKVARDIFNWSFPRQDRLSIQSTHRFAEFERSHNLNSEIKTSSIYKFAELERSHSFNPEIKISAMVTWKNLPSNKELLTERSHWRTNAFLVQVQQGGYLLIQANELEYLRAHADEEFQVHSLLISSSTQRNSLTSIQNTFKNRNLNCESIRVLSTSGTELAYSPQCSLIPTESGWELAGANEKTQLATAQESGQPVVIFHPEGKPASAVPLNHLIDAEQSSLENLQVSTLVPVYHLEGLDAEEKENSISISIADSIGQTLGFFPKQKELEVLMPEAEFILESRAKYTSIPLENPIVEYDYDQIDVTIPAEGRSITFYRLRESVVETVPAILGVLELSQNDVMTSAGELNKSHIMELAQKLHEKHALPYIVVQTGQNKFYGGYLSQLKNFFKAGEPPEKLAVMVTKLVGTNLAGATYRGHENLGWLKTTSLKVLEQSQSLGIDPSTTVTVWSSTGKREAIFNADGTLQIEQMIQWQTRPDNQTLKSLRQTWRGNMILVYVPDQGYLLAQPNEAKFLLDLAPIQIDSLMLSLGERESFSSLVSEATAAIQGLPITGSTRVLFSSINHNLEGDSFYDRTDLAFYLDNQKGLQIDLQHSGLELVQQAPEQWLNYAETKSSPLAIFQWPDGNKSLALFTHIAKVTQQKDATEIEPQLLVPAYNFEDLDDESISDQNELEESIAITLQDTLQQTLALWPNQTSFQIAMPYEEKSRLYSQDPPARIQFGSLAVIEITRQSDNTKVKYYYRPN